MADDKDDVTPEEKLLKVIQDGDGGGGQEPRQAEPVAAAAGEPEAAAPSKPEPAAAKPALKVAKSEAPSTGEAKPSAKKKAAAAPAPSASSASIAPAAFAKKKGGDRSGIRVINRMLAASIIILLGLSGFETFMAVRARGSEQASGSLQLPEARVLDLTPDEVRSAYAGDIWWRLESITGAGDGTTTQTKTITVSTTPWQQTMKGSFKLLATSMKEPKSQSKAILIDSRDNKMYFVRLGNSLMVEGTEVTLDDLEADRARFTVGGSSVELK